MNISFLTSIILGSLFLTLSCKSPVKTEGKAVNNPDLDWQTLSDTTKYSVTYIQLNLSNQLADDTFGKDILALQNNKEAKKMNLTNKQEFNLFKFITNTTNFSESDCGTFHINAGFIIYQDDKFVGKINIGCGYNQWNFQPENYKSRSGGLSKNGFTEMEKLLDDINLSNKKN
jgi:hypothetical protein